MSATAPPRLRPAAAGALALALVLALAACGSSDELGGKVVKDGLGCTVTSVERVTTDPPTIEKGAKVGKASTKKDVVKGGKDACKADATKYLTVDLVGATVADGKVFTNTFEDPQPLTLRLGTGQVLSGLETNLTGMKVGATRQIVVPASEGYGETGNAAQGIGKDADLEFAVRLISLTEAPAYCNPKGSIPEAKGKPTDFTLPTKPVTGKVKVTVLKQGTGAKVTKKSYPTVNYLGIACSNGAQFDSSWDRGEPFQFAMGGATPTATVGQVIQGWSDGLLGQKVGSLLQIDIPSDLAYGTSGRTPQIGPNDPLTFVVQIVETTEKTPAEATTTTLGATTNETTTTAAG